MAAKKTKTDAPKAEKVAAPRPVNKSAIVGGIAISDAESEILTKPIDDRMAALLKDHERMGAR